MRNPAVTSRLSEAPLERARSEHPYSNIPSRASHTFLGQGGLSILVRALGKLFEPLGTKLQLFVEGYFRGFLLQRMIGFKWF